MRDKIIGFVTARIFSEDSISIIEFIHKFAHRYNYGVVNFMPAVVYEGGAQREDFGALFMVNYEKLDALIIDAEYFFNREFVPELIAKARKYDVPCFVLNGVYDDATCIVSDIDDAYMEIIRHIVEIHGKSKISLVLRDSSKPFSKFIKLYKESLEYEGLTFDENNVVYARYIDAALAEEIPEAFVCSDDAIAYDLIAKLKKRGIRVPEDCIVAGASGAAISTMKTPNLTTCGRERKLMCEELIERIKSHFAGQVNPHVSKIESVAVYSQSCGCHQAIDNNMSYKLSKLMQQFDDSYHCNAKLCNLSERMLEVTQIEEISSVIQSVLLDNTFVCMKNSFMQDLFMEAGTGREINEDTEFYIIADTRINHKMWTSFAMKDLFPDFDEIISRDNSVYVLPLNYQGIHYGYMVCEEEEEYATKPYLYGRYMWALASAFDRYSYDLKLKFVSNELFNKKQEDILLKDRDVLTGMYNSSGFFTELDKMKAQCIKDGSTLVLACFDIAALGDINDIYGHSEGDVAIQTFAKILQENVTSDYVCGHVGSDEFVIAIITEGSPEKLMGPFFAALTGLIDNYNDISSKEYKLKINQTYLSTQPSEETDMHAFMDETFARKRVIKKSKTEQEVPKTDVKNNKISDEERLFINSIIDDNKFAYALQPIVSARTGDIYAYEALMRTRTKEPVPPFKILDVATMDNKLYEIEYSTMFNVMQHIKDNMEALEGKKVFINSIPGYMLSKNDLSKLKRRYNELFSKVVIEITEQTELDDRSLEHFRTLNTEHGFEIAVDDFGSGYSNTSNLLRYIPNYVKIDRLLISNVNDDPKKQHFVRNIIEFAHNNGFKALAEGVETEEELKAVIAMGADLIQGYYTAKPNLDIVDSIPNEISDKIIACNISNKNVKRKKPFIAEPDKEILLMRLALEEYTDIVIGTENASVVGNIDYSADMHIRIRDNSNVTLRLKDANIKCEEGEACIDIGNNSTLTLILEGNNTFVGNGIKVPESATLITAGEGNLKIECSATENYAIGNGWNDPFGQIELGCDGALNISMVGDLNIAIGGGYSDGRTIVFKRGKYDIQNTGLKCIGVGAVEGEGSASIKECNFELQLNALNCVGVGSLNGKQNIEIENAKVVIEGEGKKSFCGIGSPEGASGKARINCAHVIISGNGENVFLLGSCSSIFELVFTKARLDLNGMGTNVVGIGSYDMSGIVDMNDGLLEMIIEADNAISFGATEDNIKLTSLVKQMTVSADNP